jgi:putative ABC transport system ATP-binding protein
VTLAALPTPTAATTATGDAVAQLIRLKKTYYKPDGTVMVEALKGVDLTITKGEYVAIMGASGSGKSTLMNILGCLDKPDAAPAGGQYLLAGRDVGSMNDRELSTFRGKTIGFVFQAFNLIPQESIEDNVAVPLFYQGVPAGERRKRAAESLALVGLENRMGHKPRELSGGQQQRTAIARALVTRPVILMADEPTGNLDSATGQEILKVFERLHADGMTLIMVTHDNSIAARCQRVVRLRDGVVESDIRK